MHAFWGDAAASVHVVLCVFGLVLHSPIAALPAGQRARADEALKRLLAFDGKLAAGSADADAAATPPFAHKTSGCPFSS